VTAPSIKLAVIGDIHCAWTAFDNGYFNDSDVDAVLLVGDLPNLKSEKAYDVARTIAGLTKKAYLIPGNHDAITVKQLLAELGGFAPLCQLTGRNHRERFERLKMALGPVTLGGYSHHALADDLGLIVARPHAMGGRLTFAPFLSQYFDIKTMDESSQHLMKLVEESPHKRLVFLAHNGPAGLGDQSTDIWGCDFKRAGGDWGDPDLRDAIQHARAIGKDVIAVVAGHMHRITKSGRARIWHIERDGTQYVNAARVPRIYKDDGTRFHHHVLLTVDGSTCRIEDKLIRAS
jgi:uncharacterized protein (TIGR04168 family)